MSRFGGDQKNLSPFTTADPIPRTIVRRGDDGFIRGVGVQLLEGLIELGEIRLTFPLVAPPDDTFLAHTADGVLDWLPAGAAVGGTIDWSQIVFTPVTLLGYGILDAYTKAQIQNFFNNVTFGDTGFGSPIGGIAVRGQLPGQIAYEDEVNIFTLLNDFTAGIKTDTVNESAVGIGTTVNGLLIEKETAPALEDFALFASR